MTETTKLAPCPFCGGEAELDTRRHYRLLESGALGSAVAVYCLSCEADMTHCREDHRGIDGEDLLADLIAAWNRRASPLPARTWDVSFMRALSESTHNALVQKAIAEASKASASLSAENAQLREALQKLEQMIVQWATDEGFPPENSACLKVVRQALGNYPVRD